MEMLLHDFAHYVALAIEAIAIVIIASGTLGTCARLRFA